MLVNGGEVLRTQDELEVDAKLLGLHCSKGWGVDHVPLVFVEITRVQDRSYRLVFQVTVMCPDCGEEMNMKVSSTRARAICDTYLGADGMERVLKVSIKQADVLSRTDWTELW